MFTATLTIGDLDVGTPEQAAQVLLAVAAGNVRPVTIFVHNQHTDEQHRVEITDYPPDVLDALKSMMRYAQSRIEDMCETPDDHSAYAAAKFKWAEGIVAEAERLQRG